LSRKKHLHPHAHRQAEKFRKQWPPLEEWARKILEGDTASLSRAITLIESGRPADRTLANRLLELIMPHTGKALRIGITGIPGAGKSTFIDRLGQIYARKGHRVAVLAVDPSSMLGKGSILGDKTRMEHLSQLDRVYVRPSPGRNAGGAINRYTRESILLCEAAGYDRILVETIGAGQSESLIWYLTDLVALLKIPGAGDDLQGIKRGIMEMADIILINKADGDRKEAARQAASFIRQAFQMEGNRRQEVPVLTISAAEGTGLEETVNVLEKMYAQRLANGALQDKRRMQDQFWFEHRLDELFRQTWQNDPYLRARYEALSDQIKEGRITPHAAGEKFWETFVHHIKEKKD